MKTTFKNGKKMRFGYTTGSCAAAAAQAATLLLLTGECPEKLILHTPKGIDLTLSPEEPQIKNNIASCAIRKDSGDDPDSTNGIRIFAYVQKLTNTCEILIDGGYGIGRVTRAGLANQIGSAAINPAPKEQIIQAVKSAMQKANYTSGLSIIICAENGREIAKQTYNEHLGIVDGISILGTSGIVEPMSEQALMDTTHLELDSLYAEGQDIAFLCPGNYGSNFAKNSLKLNIEKAVKCSNFIGDAIDYAVYLGFKKILLVGHAGKLVKIAAGVMNTHSSVADARQEIFMAHAALCGVSHEILESLMKSITVDECLDILKDTDIIGSILDSIGKSIEKRLNMRVNNKVQIEYIMFTNKYGVLSKSDCALNLCKELKI